jgi:hypothetical protein
VYVSQAQSVADLVAQAADGLTPVRARSEPER